LLASSEYPLQDRRASLAFAAKVVRRRIQRQLYGHGPMTTFTSTGINYGESYSDRKGWPANGPNSYGRFWPVLSGDAGNTRARERPLGEYLPVVNDRRGE
jgi:hypothetical protein